MAFSQATITSVRFARDGSDLLVVWTTSSPSDTWYQVYCDGSLAGSTQRNFFHLPFPRDHVTVEVGTVSGIEERTTDYSGSLPSITGIRAALSWEGGTFLDSTGNDDVAGMRVYGETTAGGGIDYGTVLADVPCYLGGIITDGFGIGGFGRGGFGRSASTYEWESERLGNGTWAYAIAPYDFAGNEQGSPSTTTVTIAGPPKPPTPYIDGARLRYTYNTTAHTVTLTWQAPPA